MLRKQFSQEKASRKATGGGKGMQEWRPKSEAMNDLANLISLSICGTSPTFDDDDISGDGISDSQNTPFTVESFVVDQQQSTVEKINMEIVEYIGDDNIVIDDNATDVVIVDKVNNNDENFVIASNPSKPSTSKSWSKYTPSMLRKPNSTQLKRPPSSVSSRSDKDDDSSLINLKKKLLERELEMREIEHQTRLCQQQKEHEARMDLLAVQKMEYETKIELRRAKTAKVNNEQYSDSDPDSE